MKYALALLWCGIAAAQAPRPATVPPKPFPEYMHGDECLFCHRNDVGETWQENAHTITVRQREDAPDLEKILAAQPVLAPFGPDVSHFMLGRERVRFLKKQGYGRMEILSTQALVSAAVRSRPGGVVERSAKEWIALDRKSTRLNSSHIQKSRMPSSA